MSAAAHNHESLLGRLRPDRRTLLYGALLLNTEVIVLAAYLLVSDASIHAPRYLLYPWLWIDAALLVVWKTDPPAVDRATRRRGLAVAGAYALVLSAAGGLLGLQPGSADALLGSGQLGGHGEGLALRLGLPPGMGPALLYRGVLLRVTLLPYELIGYAALAYLVYVGVLEAAGSTLSGVVGLFSCVSCAWPVFGAVVTTLFGGGSAVAVAVATWPFDASTAIFLSALALLYWRPSW